jgi:hypothetical protein
MYMVLHNEATADGISLYVEWNPNTGAIKQVVRVRGWIGGQVVAM